MGVSRLFQTLSSHGLTPAATDISTFLQQQNETPVHLDLFGTFMHDVRRKVVEAKKSNSSIEDVGRRMAYELKELFGSSNVTIHIDGAPCTEKYKTRLQRQQRRDEKNKLTDSAIQTLERNSAKGIWTSKKVMRHITKLLQDIHVMTDEDKSKFKSGLQTVFQVCQCSTESDMCIGFQGTPSQRVIAISGDSDLLLYQGISAVVRPLPHQRRRFGVYYTNDVMEALELPSSNHLILYGSISNNDYVNNIKTLGPVKNLSLVQGVEEKDIRTMLRDYLVSTGKVLEADISLKEEQFDTAIRVFAFGKQTPVQASISNSKFDEFRDRLIAAKTLRYSVAQEKRNHQRTSQ
jgi:hypothetical protein